MSKNKVLKIVFERDGKEHSAYPVSEAELQNAKEAFIAKGLSIDNCNCGTETCHNGYWWVCTYDLNNQCQWYQSDWGCNS